MSYFRGLLISTSVCLSNIKSAAHYFRSVIFYSGQDGLTPLHLASLIGHVSVVEMLIKAGANIEKKDKVYTHVVYY